VLAILALMLDHVSLQAADLDATAHFYDTVLAAIGAHRVLDFGEAIGYGRDRPHFWISRLADRQPPAREVHVAFAADDRAQVVAFHDAAVSIGAEVLHAPRVFPEYHPDYFGAFVRDPDGNNIEAVCHLPEATTAPSA
jgi:catechol 2,3-dioxygenase-like lactoylglutathione lyase family enzyme